MAKFDLYLDGKIVQSNIDSPVVIKDLKPDTQYDDYSLTFAGKSDGESVSFKTKVQSVTGVSLDKTKLSIDTGKTATLKATVVPDNATNKAVKWASDNADVATVDNAGKVIAVKAGTANVTATSDDQGKVATIKVTVKDPVVAVTGVSLDQAELSVEEGATAQLKATVAPDNATNKKVAWKSGNPETFTIDGNGKVTGVKAGSATAVATTDDGGKTAEAKVTVTAKPEPEPDPDPEAPAE
ncbi:Putative phage protein [Weissella jogaejeotgali]|uniref:Putative phage protein n=1 Tax=Weissella jogaejeotgali TaxID=1631871 RepID=A0A1L6R9U3_9LACO|nr:Ig-like domain-containing protein [Weissella jogaejeotgali]APS41319.1 Putative phage protein [Weissella jogaejeotgali]